MGSDVESAPQESPASKEDEPQYPKGLALGLIMGAVWLSFFLVALVSSITLNTSWSDDAY